VEAIRAPLCYIKLIQDTLEVAAMLDSGSEINVVGSELVSRLSYETVPGPFSVMSGVGGDSHIRRWIKAEFMLENLRTVCLTLAENPQMGSMCLLGMPFILQIKAKIDYNLKIIELPRGEFLELWTRGPKGGLQALSITQSDFTDNKINALQEELLKSVELEGAGTHKKTFCDLLVEFHDLWRGGKAGLTDAAFHKIEVTTPYPITTPPRRMTLEQQRIADEEVDKMLKAGVIEPSNSPYVSEPVIVRKSNGEWRYCIDFRRLNRFTVSDPFPMRRIDDLISSIRSSRYFVALDLRSGYWQIPMWPESKKYTAFRTSKGLYQFTVMPFGLSNAPATFQRCMEKIFGDLHWCGVLVYLDDILIHAEDANRCLGLCQEVFKRLRENKLTINLKKCQFFPPNMRYLGHIIGGGVIRPDQSRVAALYNLKTPSNIKEFRSIFGLLSYYRQYIPAFAQKTAGITDRLRKNATLTWTEHDTILVRSLADELAQSILLVPLEGDQFCVETDSSEIAMGAILSVFRDNRRQPVEFASKKLSPAQKNWPCREREAFAIVWALNKFDGLIRGRKIQVFTDHESLQFMFSATDGKLARWAARLAEYDMTIYYQKGKNHKHVDTLSRYIEPEEAQFPEKAFCFHTSGPPSIQEVLSCQQRTPLPTGRGYIFRDGVTYYRNGIWVPGDLRIRILDGCHQCFPHGHCGAKKTKSRVLKVWNWPNLHEDVARYVKGCLTCQRLRPGLERLQGLLRPHPAGQVFEKVHIDIWGPCGYGGEVMWVVWSRSPFYPFRVLAMTTRRTDQGIEPSLSALESKGSTT
jgi:hypothetical protein